MTYTPDKCSEDALSERRLGDRRSAIVSVMKRLLHATAITAALSVTLTGCALPVTANMPETTVEQEPPTKEAPEPELTVSQENAIKKAESYLAVMAFSRSDLIAQLIHNQFPQTDAEYAVDSLDVDWNEQAAKKAEEYLDVMAFSRGDLIDQLVHNGFTNEQAEHGATSVGL